MNSLPTEARQKLEKINPETLAQAGRIPGVSPSDINVLLVLFGTVAKSSTFHVKQNLNYQQIKYWL